MPFTRFMDMHSGGGCKEEPYEYIYIEAPEEEAKIIFYNRFGHNPYRVSCMCCGEDYSIDETEILEQATAFERGCRYAYFNEDGVEIPREEALIPGKGQAKGTHSKYAEEPDNTFSFNKYTTLEEYLKKDNVLVIYDKDIKPEERVGKVPNQGYVWVD